MVKLQVSEMRCMSCVHHIEDEIRDVDPEGKITADMKNRQLEIRSTLKEEELIKLIKNAGYSAEVVTN